MTPSRAGLALTSILVIATGCAAALHGLGGEPWLRIDWSDPVGWLAVTPATDAVVALVRTAGLGCAVWVAVTTALHMVAVAAGAARAVRITAVLALPQVRRLTHAMVAGSVALATLPAFAAGATPPEPPRPVVTVDPPGRPAVALIDPDWVALRPLPESAPVGQGLRDGPVEVVVAPGDNLWRLAERRLTEARGRPPDAGEVAPYWREVIAANRGHLRSGDPDLIFPGEIVVLPSIASSRP